MKIGAQLYTVRDFCQDIPSFAETLKKVADIGYTTVQVSGSCAFDPQWLKGELDKNGLKCVITHNSADRILKETEKLCAEHKVFNCKHIGLGGFGFHQGDTREILDRFCASYRGALETIRDNGCYFMYHNHAAEFRWVDGQTVMRKMAQEISPDLLGFTLDTYWVQRGGGDPAQYLEELKGRVPCIHLKDYGYDARMEVIGEGNINFDRVFEKAEAAGTQYMLVEQDDCNGEDPFDCLKRSYLNLRAMGLD